LRSLLSKAVAGRGTPLLARPVTVLELLLEHS